MAGNLAGSMTSGAASGAHAGHGAGAAPTDGMVTLERDPAFQDLLARSAEALGVGEGELMGAMHQAEALVAGRTDMTEDQKLAVMMDFITDRFAGSDLTNEEMMTLLELCRMCLGAWQAEAAAEEGYEIVQPGEMPAVPTQVMAHMFGDVPGFQLDPARIDAPEPERLRRLEEEEEQEEDA